MATAIGDLIVTLGANTVLYERAFSRAEAVTRRFTANTTALGDALDRVSSASAEMARDFRGAVSTTALEQADQKFYAIQSQAKNVAAAMKEAQAGTGRFGSALSYMTKTTLPPFMRGFQRARDLLNHFVATSARIGFHMAAASAAMGTFAATLGSLGAGQRFREEFAKATAIMGNLTDEVRNKLKQASFDVARQVGITAGDVVKGFHYLAEAGFGVSESLREIGTLALFAKAGEMDMGQAAELATRALTAMELPLSDLGRVTNALVVANIKAQASVEDLSKGLSSNLAGSLRIANRPLEEGVALLGLLSQRGIVGEEAGMALSMVYRDLQKAAIASADSHRELHDAVYDTNGQLRNMTDILKFLEDKLAGLPPESRLKLLQQYEFQWRSLHHILSLIGGSDILEDLLKAMEDMGKVQEIAAKKATALGKAWNALKASATEAGAGMMEGPLGQLVSGAAGGTELLINNLRAFFTGEWERARRPGELAAKEPEPIFPSLAELAGPELAKKLQAQQKEQEANAKALELFEEQQERLRNLESLSSSLYEKGLTPLQRYHRALREMNDLLKKGVIKNMEEYRRLLEPIRQEYIVKPAMEAEEEAVEKRKRIMERITEETNRMAEKDREKRKREEESAAEDLAKRAESLRKSVRTPAETMKETLAEYADLFRRGAISKETLTRATREAFDEAKDTEKMKEKDREVRFAGAAMAGSAEAWASVARGIGAGQMGAKRKTEGEKEIVKNLREIKAVLKASDVAKVVDLGSIGGGR